MNNNSKKRQREQIGERKELSSLCNSKKGCPELDSIAVSLSTNSVRRQDPNIYSDTETRALSTLNPFEEYLLKDLLVYLASVSMQKIIIWIVIFYFDL